MPAVEPYKRKGGGPGKYKARLAVGKDPATGKYPRPTVIFEAESLRDAKAKAVALEAEHKERTSSGATFEDLIERWWTDNPRNNRANTRRGYRLYIDNHILPRIGHKRLRGLEMTDFTQLRLQLEAPGSKRNAKDEKAALDAGSVNQCLSICRAACRYGIEGLGWLSHNPAAVYRSRKPTKKVESTTKADYMAVASSIKELNLQTMVVMAALTGARASELVGLKWENLSYQTDKEGEVMGGTMTIAWMVDGDGDRLPTKTHNTRDVPLDLHALGWLGQWRDHQLGELEVIEGKRRDRLDPDWFIWPDETEFGKPSLVSEWSERVHKAAKAVGLEGAVNLRGLRHLAATLMTNNPSISPATASQILGHANTSMTLDVYAAPLEEQAALATSDLSDELRF